MARILVVDDAAFARRLLVDQLVRKNHEIVGEAMNGTTAIQAYKRLRPDIVMMDVLMEGMSGLDALHEILQFDEEANVIMVSAQGKRRQVIDAITRGAKNYILKPIQSDKLFHAVDKIVCSKPKEQHIATNTKKSVAEHHAPNPFTGKGFLRQDVCNLAVFTIEKDFNEQTTKILQQALFEVRRNGQAAVIDFGERKEISFEALGSLAMMVKLASMSGMEIQLYSKNNVMQQIANDYGLKDQLHFVDHY